MNFFKTKPRTPLDLVRGLRDSLPKLDSAPPGEPRKRVSTMHHSIKYVSSVLIDSTRRVKKCRRTWLRLRGCCRVILVRLQYYVSVVSLMPCCLECSPEVIAQLAQETYQTDLLHHLLLSIHRLEFEARKDVVQIFNNLLRRQIGSRFPTVEYLCKKPEIMFTAFRGYENEEVALNTGMILREMLRHEPLAKILLHSELFYKFPHYIETTTFGISCDAYTNLKETLTRHKPMVAEYLDKNYDRVGDLFCALPCHTNGSSHLS